jgi:hypothetical protein
MTIRAGVPVLLLAALACGGGGSTAGTDAAPVEAGTVPMSCELAAQTGCAVDEQCSVFCDAQKLVVACRTEPANGPALEQPCMNVPCARGGICMAASGMAATCRKLCTTTDDCPAPQACHNITTTYGCAVMGPMSLLIRACL